VTARAPVDELRALPAPLAEAVLARLEPEEVAALRYEHDFWARAAQRLPRQDDLRTIEVFFGEFGTGKTWTARSLFMREILTGRALSPRIVLATDADVRTIAVDGASGIRAWLPPHIACRFTASAGYAGDLKIGDAPPIVCCSAAAGGQGTGMSRCTTWADDPASWVEQLGAAAATKAWNTILRSTREGNRDGRSHVFVSTTNAGAEFIWRLLSSENRNDRYIRLHDLGAVEANAGNLSADYVQRIVPGMRAAGEFYDGARTGAFSEIRWPELRVSQVPRLVRIIVFIDPAKTSTPGRSCEVGIVAAGIDEHGIVYGLADRSRVASASEWPAIAHELLEEMRDRYGCPVAFGIEVNAGGKELLESALRAEEKLRRAKRGLPPVSVAEIRSVTSRPNDSKTARARDVVAMAKGRQVLMVHGLGELEGQLSALSDTAPGNDRADAFVHAARDLAGLGDDKAVKRAAAEQATREAFQGFEEAQGRMPTPSWGRPAEEEGAADEWDRA
jgi:phage terminase large subunit-like protein